MFDISAILIFSVLICANLSKNKLKGKTNLFFFQELIISTITIIFRLIYQFILRYGNNSNATVIIAKIFVYASLIAHNFVYPIGIYFVFSSFGILRVLKRKESLKFLMIFLIYIPLLYIFIDFISQTLFVITDDLTLEYLPPFRILSLCSMGILFFGLAMMIYYRRFLSIRQFVCGISLIPLNGIIFIIQNFFPEVQIEMFVIAITCYIISSTIQRPELLINHDTGAQSGIAYDNELKKAINIYFPSKIILIRIENYKNINMYIGNEKFLEFLKKVTKYLTELSKSEKLNAGVYYLGNYIFALPTENQSDTMINGVLDNLEKYFSQVFQIDCVKINLDTRICVIRYPEDNLNYDFLSYISREFYKVVDKTTKPQWYRDFTSDQNFIIKNNINEILDRAIKEKRFEVYYQPIFNVKKHAYCSAEALVRLNDPLYGNIPPGMFLDYAEKTNKIHIIGDFVIEKVCEFIGSEEFGKLNLDNIEINLSVSQCVETELVQKIIHWINIYKIDPECIRLDITESAASFNPVVVEKNINSLKSMGIHFSLDDYGTGYSNIKKVISLPFDVVKLNKSFVDEIENPKSVSLVEDTIHLLKSLGKEVLIEGVETEDRAELFKNFKIDFIQGCEYLQGFYFSRPLPQTEFVKFLTI